MRILIDMKLSPAWAQFLVAHGIEAVHWSTIGEMWAPDSRILDYAASNWFVVARAPALTLGAVVVKETPAKRARQAKPPAPPLQTTDLS
jgi:predicted nuclease of predicted toxin-antitoxin system